jgi:hypothetical protein
MEAFWSHWVSTLGPRTLASPWYGNYRYVHYADCTTTTALTPRRLSDDSHPSGRASTTTKTLGQNTSSWQSSTADPSPLPMTSLQKSRRGRATILAQHGTLAAQSPVSTTSLYPSSPVACPRTRTAPPIYRLHTLPFLFPHPPLPSLPTPRQRHSSEVAQRHWRRLPPARVMPRRLTWPPKS